MQERVYAAEEHPRHLYQRHWQFQDSEYIKREMSYDDWVAGGLSAERQNEEG